MSIFADVAQSISGPNSTAIALAVLVTFLSVSGTVVAALIGNGSRRASKRAEAQSASTQTMNSTDHAAVVAALLGVQGHVLDLSESVGEMKFDVLEIKTTAAGLAVKVDAIQSATDTNAERASLDALAAHLDRADIAKPKPRAKASAKV
jgi:hypothetical protein